MISLELARKLKEAGLEWEPKLGDHYIIPAVFEVGLHEVMDTKQIMSYHKNPKEWEESIRGFVFAPRLDQLLAEIEKWGYSWEMRTVIDESQSVRFNAKNIAYWIHVWKTGHIEWEDGFKRAFTFPSNAAASALLWIYEGRAKA